MRWPVSLSTQVFGGSSARAKGASAREASAVISASDDAVDRMTEDMAGVLLQWCGRSAVAAWPGSEHGGGLAACESFIHCDGCDWEIVSYTELRSPARL